MTTIRRIYKTALVLTIASIAVAGVTAQQNAAAAVLDVPQLDQEPQRIVAAGRAVLMIADALYAFPGAGENLVAVGRIDQGRGNFLRALDPGYGTKTILDRNVGPEQIAASRPDLVVLKSFMRDSLGRPLETIGVPVMYVDLENPEQYDRDLNRLGHVLGMSERADELRSYYQSVLDRIAGGTESLPAGRRPKVLFAYAEPGEQGLVVNVPSAAWIQTNMVETAGGNPVWADAFPGGGWHKVGLEQIAAWRPEVMFLVSYRNDVETIEDQLLNQSPLGQTLEAMGTDVQIVPIDFYSWDQPDVRWALGLQWMATRLQPQRFSDIDMTQEVYRFYNTLYGMSPAKVDEIIFSRLTGELE